MKLLVKTVIKMVLGWSVQELVRSGFQCDLHDKEMTNAEEKNQQRSP